MLKRTLWYQDKDNHMLVAQEELTQKISPLVIVGEAGMGKSCLLEWLGSLESYSYCTARQLINRPDPKTLLGDNSILVIDALDELSSRNDGDSVDRVLQKLGQLGYPQFVLSCRVADWRSATGLQAIREQYTEEPIELHLSPFNQDDITQFLGEKLGVERAQEVIEHFITQGLDDLLGNPQTLNLIIRVAKMGSLPDTLTQLFEQAVDLLSIEHSDFKAETQLAREIVLDASGAAFASLILTGNEAITRKAIANIAEGELPLSEIKLLPDSEKIDLVLGSRLFRSNGMERFSYLHRRIGEFLGAKWLIKQATTPHQQRRLLSFFHSYEFVPASLRGLHAWLVNDPALSFKIIKSDPMGILEYSNAAHLTVEQAHVLLESVKLLAEKNPRFYNRNPYNIQAFTDPIILGQIREFLSTPELSFSFRIFLVDSIKASQLPIDFIEMLKKLVLDPDTEYAIRKSAGEALANQKQHIDWQDIFLALANLYVESSIRLAIELLHDTGFDKTDDELIARLAFSYIESDDNVIGPLWFLQEYLPQQQVENVLNFFVGHIKSMENNFDWESKYEANDFACHLIMRVLKTQYVSAEQLWGWLEPFNNSDSYYDESVKKLEAFLIQNQTLRQAIQYLVLLDEASEKNIWQKAACLSRSSLGLAVKPEDITILLRQLFLANPNDERWKDIVQLAYHDGGAGKEIREEALPFTINNLEDRQWLENLAIRPLADWEIKSIENKQKREEKRKAAQAEHRLFYLQNLELLRQGDYGVLLNLAKAYLKLFSDIGKDIPAHKRIIDWVGEDISNAALAGFEAFLIKNPPEVSAHDIATILPQGRFYEAGYIIIAALAERIRNDIGFDDLPDERLKAGFFILLHNRYDERAGINELFERIEHELQKRKAWAQSIKEFYEPKFEARCTYMNGLARLMRNNKNRYLSIELAKEWLQQFTDIPIEPESELIDCLLHNGETDALRQLISSRIVLTAEEKQRNWLVIGLIVNFEDTAKQLEGEPIDKELIWNIRDRLNGRYRGNKAYISLGADMLEWTIKTFRMAYPNVYHPTGGSSGSQNPWDASEFIISMIHQLGKDPTDNACEAMGRLENSCTDGYTELIKTLKFEQKQIRSENLYTPPSLEAIKAITNDLIPQTITDLQTVILDELLTVEAKIKSDDAESWRGFYDDNGKPHHEERCRDHLLSLLRQGNSGITFEPETHVAGDKEVDITASTPALRLPIEIKGQWHRDLWIGADQQLNLLYTQDWRAENRGIYLVLWFGARSDRKKLQTLGKGKPIPTTPKELKEMLIANSRAAQTGQISIVVLNIERT
jgi:hypothetical protein